MRPRTDSHAAVVPALPGSIRQRSRYSTLASRSRGSSHAIDPTSSGIAAAQTDQKHLDELHTQLAQDLALGFTEKHPDIIRLRQEIKDAEANAGHAALPTNQEALLQADPIYRQKVQERNQTKVHITELQVQARHAEQQISEYQARVDAAPAVEQELTSLTNRYNLEKVHYDNLNDAYEKAKSAELMAQRQAGEGFRVLYPANLPDAPIAPNALKVFAAAIVAGLVLGAAAALGREFLDRSVHDVRSLQNEFQVPVLAEIPRIGL